MYPEASIVPAVLETLAVVTATLLGPIFAVQIQKYLDRARALEARQTAVFRTMMTRRLALSIDNVQAFNAVPVEFYGDEGILAAWRAYVAHMGVPADVPDPATWHAKRLDLFFDLLQKMAKKLGYDYNFVQLKDDFYRPKGHDQLESDQEVIRRGLAGLFSGDKPLPLDVKGFPADPVLNSLLKRWLTSIVPPEE
jgi:hypothetical protein